MRITTEELVLSGLVKVAVYNAQVELLVNVPGTIRSLAKLSAPDLSVKLLGPVPVERLPKEMEDKEIEEASDEDNVTSK